MIIATTIISIVFIVAKIKLFVYILSAKQEIYSKAGQKNDCQGNVTENVDNSVRFISSLKVLWLETVECSLPNIHPILKFQIGSIQLTEAGIMFC